MSAPPDDYSASAVMQKRAALYLRPTAGTVRIIYLIAACACIAHDAYAQTHIVIRNVTVIPITGVRPLQRQAVVVREGRIAAIGPAASVRAPVGATIIDGTG